MKAKRTFLLFVVVSLSIAALFGIYVLLFGAFGTREGQILASTAIFGLFSLVSLGASVVYERGHWRPMMLVTYVLAALGFLYYVALIWGDLERRFGYDDWIWQAAVLFIVWPIALPYTGAIGLAPRQPKLLRWVRLLTMLAVLTFASTITLAVFFGDNYELEELFARLIGVTGIIAALGTVAVPILAAVSQIDKVTSAESTQMHLSIVCPRCMTQQTVQTGHSRCRTCRLKFEIRIEEPRCPKCNYLLHKLTEPKCPECGHALSTEEVALTPVEASESP